MPLTVIGLDPPQVILVVGGGPESFTILGTDLNIGDLKAFVLDEKGEEIDCEVVVSPAGQILSNEFPVTAFVKPGGAAGGNRLAGVKIRGGGNPYHTAPGIKIVL